VGPIGAILAVFFSFFFSVVSARMVGVIGASNNPVSGMTIATLLVIASIYRAMGATGTSGMQIVLMAAGVVCVAIAVAGGVAQSLKATYIVGGSPRKIQHGMFISLAIASVAAGATVLLLHNAYTIGGEQVAAPQATLMRLIVEGIMTGRLPWTLVIIGAVIAVFCALAKLPILPVALGIYLPISLNAAIFFGGIIRKLVEMKFKKDESNLETSLERGTLIASGLVAGDALTGILIGIFAALNIRIDFLAGIITNEAVRNLVTLGIFVILAGWLYRYSINIKGSRDNA
jgi:putative OPT family oligopeptide transporter